jgi:hypothetical protein
MRVDTYPGLSIIDRQLSQITEYGEDHYQSVPINYRFQIRSSTKSAKTSINCDDRLMKLISKRTILLGSRQ